MKEFSVNERWCRAAAGRLKIPPDEYVAALNRGEKICGGCKRSLPRTTEFFRDSGRGLGIGGKCKRCSSPIRKANYEKNRPAQRARQLAYQRANRPKLYAYNSAWQRARWMRVRGEMLEAYGGRCCCCGEAERIFLDLDHVHNDGARHRKEMGNQMQIMLDLQARGWPEGDVQLLCCNCNQGKARNGGICPHAKNRS